MSSLGIQKPRNHFLGRTVPTRNVRKIIIGVEDYLLLGGIYLAKLAKRRQIGKLCLEVVLPTILSSCTREYSR